MRTRFFTMALGAALIAPAAFAEEPAPPATGAPESAVQAQQRPSQQQTGQQDQAGREHTADPNFRWHNDRWWYWQNDGWLMWDGGRWLNGQERISRVDSFAPRRSFSYTEDAQGFIPTDAGLPQSTASGLRRGTVGPGTVEYQRVVPSYGMRSAGSKVLGNY